MTAVLWLYKMLTSQKSKMEKVFAHVYATHTHAIGRTSAGMPECQEMCEREHGGVRGREEGDGLLLVQAVC